MSVRGIAAAGLVAAACSEPLPRPPVTIAYDTDHFTILDEAALDSATIVMLAGRLELEYSRVGQVLAEITPPVHLTAQVRAGLGLPYVTAEDSSLTLWSDTLALDYLPHQLTHLYTRYARREFLEEGLAVYLSELLLPDEQTVHPYRRQPSHAWVSLFQQNASLIPFATVYAAHNLGYSIDGSTFDASAWQVYLEGGSFVRWVVETYGWPAWWDLYRTDDPVTTLDTTAAALEEAWLATTRAQFPEPLPCEEALGTVGPREEFWCRRARGESSAGATRALPLPPASSPRPFIVR